MPPKATLKTTASTRPTREKPLKEPTVKKEDVRGADAAEDNLNSKSNVNNNKQVMRNCTAGELHGSPSTSIVENNNNFALEPRRDKEPTYKPVVLFNWARKALNRHLASQPASNTIRDLRLY